MQYPIFSDEATLKDYSTATVKTVAVITLILTLYIILNLVIISNGYAILAIGITAFIITTFTFTHIAKLFYDETHMFLTNSYQSERPFFGNTQKITDIILKEAIKLNIKGEHTCRVSTYAVGKNYETFIKIKPKQNQSMICETYTFSKNKNPKLTADITNAVFGTFSRYRQNIQPYTFSFNINTLTAHEKLKLINETQ